MIILVDTIANFQRDFKFHVLVKKELLSLYGTFIVYKQSEYPRWLFKLREL